MTEYRVQLAGVSEHQDAVRNCYPGDSLSILGDRGDARYWLVRDASGHDLGTLPRRGKLIDAVLGGDEMTSASVQCRSSPTDKRDHYALSINVKCRGGTDLLAYKAGLQALRAMPAISPSPATLLKAAVARVWSLDIDGGDTDAGVARSYPVGIVGEANYQPAIETCAVGDRALIVIEENNPYDDDALAVTTEGGATIGYIARDSWLYEAINEEGKGCSATIRAIERAPGSGELGVVLTIMLDQSELTTRSYVAT